MKLAVRLLVFAIIMIIIAIVMYKVMEFVVLPWLLSCDGLELAIGLILSVMFGMIIWCGIAEWVGKLLKCDKIVEKFIGEE